MASHYNIDDILKSVTLGVFDRGKKYAQQGKVKDIQWRKQGNEIIIEGKVKGNNVSPYHQKITIPAPDLNRRIHGECSCPVKLECKHIAALLIYGLVNQPKPIQFNKNLPANDLDPELNKWLDHLNSAEQDYQNLDTYPDEIQQRLIYVIDPTHDLKSQILIHPQSVRLLGNGTFSTSPSIPYRFNNIASGITPRHFRKIDNEIIYGLHAHNLMNKTDAWQGSRLSGKEGHRLLMRILSTGRCFWSHIHGPQLISAPARTAELRWQNNTDGSQTPIFSFNGGSVSQDILVLPLEPPCYIDTQKGEVGEIKTGLSPALNSAFALAPNVPAEQTALLTTEMKKRFPQDSIPKPATLKMESRKGILPIPCLKLFIGKTYDVDSYGYNAGPPVEIFMARLSFEYDGFSAPWTSDKKFPKSITFVKDDCLIKIQRNRKEEEKADKKMKKLGFELIDNPEIFDLSAKHKDIHAINPFEEVTDQVQFCLHDIPALEQDGWKIDATHLPFHFKETEDIFADIEEGTGKDWFELDMGVNIDGKRVDLVPIFVDFLRSMETEEDILKLSEKGQFLVPAEGKNVLAIPAKRITPLLIFLMGLLKTEGLDNGKIRLPRYRSAEIFALENESEEILWRGGETFRELGRKLSGFRGIEPAQIPQEFTGKLRSYQQEGLNWLEFLREYQMGGILADDMGLGKTVQTLAYFSIEKAAQRLTEPSLIVMPTSVLPNWLQETHRFAPNLTMLSLHGSERKERFDEIDKHDLIFTTYPLLSRDKSVFLSKSFNTVILDEAQVIKNPKAQASRVARQLKTKHRFCLTGTPMENHLGDLWSIMAFLMPGMLGSEKFFRRIFRNPIEIFGDQARNKLLSNLIKPFVLRRTKEQVEEELPDKQILIEHIPLSKEQKELYETVRLTMDSRVRAEIAGKGLSRSHIIVLDALLKLRQVCCDPRLVKTAALSHKKIASAKLARLMEMLPEMIEEGRRILLFSQFTSMLSLIEEELNAQDIPYLKLTGQTKDRKTPVKSFQDGEVPLFLISLKAGGTGLNLTAADTVIHYDPWWNPAVEMQATDRAHRIGQNKKVFVYKLVAEATVEDKILALQEKKRTLADGVLVKKDQTATNLSEDDLKNLFEPLPVG
ncbi:MAG: helicase [Nitrospinae bacterium CG11_big_fil_rev_8_21_14_0_20_45_15]|nr:MAG: helicase [Nitrospinae bacterium CG11_big_fil_rev_8_21_14_0_20_45_15]